MNISIFRLENIFYNIFQKIHYDEITILVANKLGTMLIFCRKYGNEW